MATAVQLWRDCRGFLHEEQAAARLADDMAEREDRRAVVHKMLVDQLKQTSPARLLPAAGPFETTAQVADWLIANWPVLRAIGFSLRVHELSSQGEVAVTRRAA